MSEPSVRRVPSGGEIRHVDLLGEDGNVLARGSGYTYSDAERAARRALARQEGDDR